MPAGYDLSYQILEQDHGLSESQQIAEGDLSHLQGFLCVKEAYLDTELEQSFAATLSALHCCFAIFCDMLSWPTMPIADIILFKVQFSFLYRLTSNASALLLEGDFSVYWTLLVGGLHLSRAGLADCRLILNISFIYSHRGSITTSWRLFCFDYRVAGGEENETGIISELCLLLYQSGKSG